MHTKHLYDVWGRNIAAARTYRRVTQLELASRCHVSQGTISLIERGARGPSDELKLKICEVLNREPGDLFPWEEVPA